MRVIQRLSGVPERLPQSFVEGIEDGDSQIRACATTFVQVGRLIFISALIV